MLTLRDPTIRMIKGKYKGFIGNFIMWQDYPKSLSSFCSVRIFTGREYKTIRCQRNSFVIIRR